MSPDQYCRQKVIKSGSSFYYSFLFLNDRQRQAITALYAFCREVDDIVDNTSDIALAATQLDWWRQEIARLYTGKATHPISIALTSAIAHYPLQQTYFLAIIDGMEMDLQQQTYQDFEALKNYCYHVAGVVGKLAIEIFGYQHPNTLLYAEQLGLALQLTNIIRDVREDAQRGRIYLAEHDLRRFNVSSHQLLALESSTAFTALLAEYVQRAEHYYQLAHKTLIASDRAQQKTGLMMANIYRLTLQEIARDNYAVMQYRTSLTPLRKLWIAWRTARNPSYYPPISCPPLSS